MKATKEIIERISEVLRGMLDGTMDLVLGYSILARFNSDGYEIVPIKFVGFSSDLDEVPKPAQYHLWEPVALNEEPEIVENYQEDILAEAKALLNKISTSEKRF
jgi:hypothetical protein